jgi:flagellar basal-body rod modification protein FlgD
MTVLAALSAAGSVAKPITDAAKASLDYDSFLKLLLQQLKSQDPTSPVDQKETLAQLASFSNVEQTIKLNQKLDAILDQQRILQGSALVGKHVTHLASGVEGTVQSVSLREGKLSVTLETGQSFDLGGDVQIRS